MSSTECHIRLREERVRLGYNQTEFAGAAGTTQRSQTAYESGGRSPDLEYLAAIAAIGADVNYIVTGVRLPTGKGISVDDAQRASEMAFGMVKSAAVEVSPQQFGQMVKALLPSDGGGTPSADPISSDSTSPSIGHGNMVATGSGIVQVGGTNRFSGQRKMKSN